MKKLFFSLLCLAVAASAYAVTPADPTNVSWYDCGSESGYSKLNFTLPTVDTNGNSLNSENMGYRVYLDNGQLFTFEQSVYTYDDIYGDVSIIYNWQYSGGVDFRPNYIYFYRTNADGYTPFFTWRIGLQVVYVNDNNEMTYSNIVYDEVFPQATLPKPGNPSLSEFIDYGLPVGINLGYEIAQDFDGNYVGNDYTIDKYFNGEEYTKLDASKLSFSIYTDNDQIFTFTPEMFPNQVNEPLTQFPLSSVTDNGIVGNWDIHFGDLTSLVDQVDEPFFTWRIGIQTNYTDAGQTSSSDIIYMEIYPQLKPAAEVTSTSFLADWSCNAENTFIINNFIGDGCGYFLYVVDKATQEVVLTQNVAPANTTIDEWGYTVPLPGATYTVEGLTPGATYQFYVEVVQNTGMSYKSVVREVTLPAGGHGYELGDVNHDEEVSIADVSDLVDYLLGNSNTACPICADFDQDGEVAISDVSALIDFLLGN